MTTAGRARTYQCELKHDRNCHQCDKAGGSRDEQKRGDTRALICMYTGDERHAPLHVDEFYTSMPLSAEAECLSHFNS